MNFSFEGRLNRLPYFQWHVAVSICTGIAQYLVNSSSSTLISLVGGVLGIIMFICYLSLIVRRLHDLDKSGYFALIWFIPLIGFLFSIYLMFAKGTDGPNQYGADPLNSY